MESFSMSKALCIADTADNNITSCCVHLRGYNRRLVTVASHLAPCVCLPLPPFHTRTHTSTHAHFTPPHTPHTQLPRTVNSAQLSPLALPCASSCCFFSFFSNASIFAACSLNFASCSWIFSWEELASETSSARSPTGFASPPGSAAAAALSCLGADTASGGAAGAVRVTSRTGRSAAESSAADFLPAGTSSYTKRHWKRDLS
mmetsp:Transcript_51788/g.116271  ORF Transcript_51788/g.116271 Transcript_51788/m.116271 type:complete len:203 (+) Transcript_51788:573-1181(+)